jgi:translocation and assembly module TamA
MTAGWRRERKTFGGICDRFLFRSAYSHSAGGTGTRSLNRISTSRPFVVAVLAAGFAVAAGLVLAQADGNAPLLEEVPTPTEPFQTGAAGTGADESAVGVAEDSGERLNYAVSITGVDGELLDLMERSSLLQELIERPPPTLGGILRRVKTDQERFSRVLRSRGYYDGEVTFQVDTEREPVAVTFSIEPGQAFILDDYVIHYVDPEDQPEAPGLETLDLELGMRAEAARIVAAGNLLINALRNDARPFAREVDRRAVVDFEHRTMSVDVFVEAGPRAGFGPVTFKGLERTKEDYVRQWVNWSPGDPFRQSDLDALQRKLSRTGLFTAIAVDRADEVAADGNVPVMVEAVPSTHRSVGGSIGFSTDRGATGRVFWEHRNLLGRDENLRFVLSGDFLQQAASIQFTRPNFRELDRTLFARTGFQRSDTDAFEGFEGQVAAGLSWLIADRWSVSVGGAIEYANLEDNLDEVEGRTTSILGSIPTTVSYRNVDSELDPTSGFRLDLLLTPSFGQSNNQPIAFHATEVEGAAYYPVDTERRFVLAGRARVGSIVGADLADIPANRRFYAGGGGSIRGYEFQRVGPLDAEGNPIGGRSRAEVSAEVRVRVWREIGLVPFIAGGQVYESAYPDFSDSFQWAAGLGLRYHTVVGPLRLDVAFPINRREGIDDFFQLYISLGQAF